MGFVRVSEANRWQLAGLLEKGQQLERMSPGQWQVIDIPLSSLATREALKSVTAAVAITTRGRLKLSISAVELWP